MGGSLRLKAGLEVTQPLKEDLMEPQLFTSPFQDPMSSEAVGVDEDMTALTSEWGWGQGLFGESRCFTGWVEIKEKNSNPGFEGGKPR